MNNYFWDTHAHIFKEYYENIDEVINNANINNIAYIINSGVDNKSNKEVIDTSNIYDNVFCTIGIHPEAVHSYNKEDIEFIKNNLDNKKILAIGEIGLDYHYEIDSKEKQINLFEIQLKLAEEYNIPVVIHSRDATKDTLDTLKKYNVKGIVHSFSGSLETANEYIKMGFLLGVNGVITFKNCNIKDVYKKLSLTNIVLETDSPYLSPVPLRGKTNEPANIMYIAEFLSTIYDVSLEQIADITRENIERIFDKLNIIC